MKTSLFIQIDTDKEFPITLSKPSEISPPETDEDKKIMVLNDIAALIETLSLMINVADEKKYGEKNQLINAAIQRLEDLRG